MLLSDSDYQITGTPKSWHDEKTDSGTPLDRYFCGNCGSPIMSVTPLMPGKAFIKLGLFKEIPKPQMEAYIKDRDEWEPPLPGVAQFNTVPGA